MQKIIKMFIMNNQLSDLNVEELEYRKSLNRITLLAIAISSVSAVLYWILRFGFDDNSIFEIIKTLSAGFLLLITPDFIYRYFSAQKASREQRLWTRSVSFLSILTLFFLVFLGFISLLAEIKIIYLLLPAAFVLFILFLIRYFVYFFKKSDVLLIALFILFSFWVAGLIWGAKYHNPLFREQIIMGFAHPDILFYSAVSNLIKTYGFPSTGLDGLPYLHFHWGGMWFFSYLSGLLNVSAIKFYNLCYPAIFIPFYFKSLLLFIIDLKRYKKFSSHLGLLFFTLLFIVYIGRDAFADLGNEAYLMAVSFTFLLFSMIISVLKAGNGAKSYFAHDKLFFYLLLPVFIGIIGLTKISIGFLLFGLYGYLFLRMKWYKNNKILISFLLSSLIFPAVYLATANKGVIIGYNNLSQIIMQVESWNLFFSVDYLFLWIFIFLVLFQEKVYTLRDLNVALRQKRLIKAEILLVIAFLGLLPGVVLNIDGGSGWYFSNFQKLLGLCLVLAYLSSFIRTRAKEEPFFSYFGKLKIQFLFIILFIILANISFINNYTQIKRMFGKNIVLRVNIFNQTDFDFEAKEFVRERARMNGFFKTLKSVIPASKLSQKFLKKQKNYELVKLLEDLGRINRNEKKKTCIYIPKNNGIFWNLKIYKDYAHIRPFIVTALTGMAMIGGLPEGELPDIRDYYYYKKAGLLKGGSELKYDSIQSIRASANAKGFSNVIIIKEENNRLVMEKI